MLTLLFIFDINVHINNNKSKMPKLDFKKRERKVVRSVVFLPFLIKRIDEEAKKHEVSRSKLICTVMEKWLNPVTEN